MARAKNRGYQDFFPSYSNPTRTRRWRMAIYIRLSKEDLQKIRKGLDCSNSVKNQRDILNFFYQSHIEEFESITEYIDDGHTGTDTDREDFQRMMADIMSHKVNCVVVKDLSRLARNYSDAGSLIDNLFVQMGVRFISLAENVDSYLDPDSVSDIKVPITNVMNDNYCFQTSKKIRQVFDYKRRSGQYIGSFAPFGYVKDSKDKHQLVVDPDAAETVKLIYSMFLQGSSKRAIGLYLNEHGIPSPSAYDHQTTTLTAVLEKLTVERAELASGVDNEHPALVAFMKYQNIECLTRDILVELVDHIKVYENGNISVRFKFADELRKIVEYIELNTEPRAQVV